MFLKILLFSVRGGSWCWAHHGVLGALRGLFGVGVGLGFFWDKHSRLWEWCQALVGVPTALTDFLFPAGQGYCECIQPMHSWNWINGLVDQRHHRHLQKENSSLQKDWHLCTGAEGVWMLCLLQRDKTVINFPHWPPHFVLQLTNKINGLLHCFWTVGSTGKALLVQQQRTMYCVGPTAQNKTFNYLWVSHKSGIKINVTF